MAKLVAPPDTVVPKLELQTAGDVLEVEQASKELDQPELASCT
jgi:hypothetical protein